MNIITKNLIHSFELIKGLSFSEITAEGLTFDFSNPRIVFGDDSLVLKFDAKYSDELNDAFGEYQPRISIHFKSNKYIIPKGASFFGGNLIVGDTEMRTYTIKINKIVSGCFENDNEYYYRLMYPIDRGDWGLLISGIDFLYKRPNCLTKSGGLLAADIDKGQIHIYFAQDLNNKYLVIDCCFKTTANQVYKISNAVRLSIALFTGRFYGSYYYQMAFEKEDFDNPIGLKVSVDRSSFVCRYRIYDNNIDFVRSLLQRNSCQQRAFDEIKKMIPYDDSCWYFMDNITNYLVFSNLVRLLYNDNNLMIACSLLLEATTQPVIMQESPYLLALEAITSYINKQTVNDRDNNTPIIDKELYNKSILPKLNKIIEDVFGIDSDVTKIIKGRLKNSLNNKTNQRKLEDPYDSYGYKLTKLDISAISERNKTFHGHLVSSGDLAEKEAKKFAISLRLHKLCCVLLLKLAGFEGYILNNEVLFGFEEACLDENEHAMIKI